MKQLPWLSADPTEPMFDVSAAEILRVSHDPVLTQTLDLEIEADLEVGGLNIRHDLRNEPTVATVSHIQALRQKMTTELARLTGV
jgi:hypothetical protein